MSFAILLAPEAVQDLKSLKANVRADVRKDDLSRYLREAETQEIVITRHGKPAGILIGFESEEDWFEYRLENDHDFCAGSNWRALVCNQGAELIWKTSKRNNDLLSRCNRRIAC